MSRDELRRRIRAEVARLPLQSLPTGPVSPDAVRELAADLATAVLGKMSEPSEDTEGFASRGLGYECTGASYSCTLTYSCEIFRPHKCANHFACPLAFSSPTLQFRRLG
jgi:hypothetical protein